MTNAQIQKLIPGTLIVNGRRVYTNHLSTLTKTGHATWTVERYGDKYTIEGGKRAGGRRNEWYVDSPTWNGSAHCTSLVDALRMLDNQ